MSRTLKDRPAKLRFPDDYLSYEKRYDKEEYIAEYSSWTVKHNPEYLGKTYNATNYTKKPGILTKKKRKQCTEFKWYKKCPSSWVNLYMNRPERRQHKLWEVLAKQELYSYRFKKHFYFQENWYDYLWAWETQPFSHRKNMVYYY